MSEVKSKFFKDYILDQKVNSDQLPLVHVCDGYTFREIFTSGVISPTLCKVFESEIAYFFYGRPSYRVNNADSTTSSKAMFPICLIMDSAALTNISSAYPFDTGAFIGKLFSDYIHPKSKLSNYEFDNDFDFIGKYVKYFYSSNEKYYDGIPEINESDIPELAYELQSLHQLLTSGAQENFDDRCHTIEVQSTENVNISNGTLKAIVLPSSLASDPNVSSFMFDNNVEPITYFSGRTQPSSLSPLIINEVRKYYHKEGMI